MEQLFHDFSSKNLKIQDRKGLHKLTMSTPEETFQFNFGDEVTCNGIQELLPAVESDEDLYEILTYMKGKIGKQGVLYYYNIIDYPAALVEKWRENTAFLHIIDKVVIARDKLLAAKQHQSNNPGQSQVAPRVTTITNVVEYLNGLISTAPQIKLEIFQNYHREYIGACDLEIPQVPLIQENKPQPHMLLFDVDNESHKESAVYKYLTTVKESGPCALFAVSGGGKTRRVLEFLSHNYGFYFLARRSPIDRNPGSGDMNYVIKRVNSLSEMVDDKHEYRRESIVEKHMYGLLLGRLLVFQRLKQVLGDALSPYVWMLAQLHPELINGQDVFKKVASEIFLNIDVKAYEDLYKDLASQIQQQFHCFVDEAQSLLRILPWAFPSESSPEKKRSMYSAVLKSLTSIADFSNTIFFPCFSGTGMSADSFKEAVGSAVAKLSMRSGYNETFSSFDMLTFEQVGKYLESLGAIDFGTDDEKLRKFYDHGLKWLRGRPRWSATFASLWMRGLVGARPTESAQDAQPIRNSVGKHPVGDTWLRAIQDYVHLMTTKPTEVQKWVSGSIVHASAYAIFAALGERVRDQQRNAKGDTKATKETMILYGVYNSVMEFALNGKPVRMTENVFELIEYGLCAVEHNGYEISACLGEPIIVEAGLHYYSNPKSEDPDDTSIAQYFEKQLTTTSESSSQGFIFEKLLLPFIRAKFQNLQSLLVEQRIQVDEDLSSFSVGLTSYGILAKRCLTSSETLGWIQDSIDAAFDGAVPPFCLPDSKMGPDILNLLRDKEWRNFIPLLLQVKFTNHGSQTDAIRSVTPGLLYKINRRQPEPEDALQGAELDSWNDLFKKLFEKEDKQSNLQSLYGLIQFPKKRTKNSEPGIFEKHARLCWDRDSIEQLVGDTVKDTLKIIKKNLKTKE